MKVLRWHSPHLVLTRKQRPTIATDAHLVDCTLLFSLHKCDTLPEGNHLKSLRNVPFPSTTDNYDTSVLYRTLSDSQLHSLYLVLTRE